MNTSFRVVLPQVGTTRDEIGEDHMVDCCSYGLHMATTLCIHTLGSPLPH